MKRKLVILGLILTLVALPLAACAKPAPAPAEVIELKYATDETPRHERYTNVVIPFQREIEARTNHRVRITSFPAESLIAADDTFDSVVTGVVEMGDANTLYTPGRFQLTEATGIPGLGFADPYIGTMAGWDLYKKFPEVQRVRHLYKALFWGVQYCHPLSEASGVFLATKDNIKRAQRGLLGFLAEKEPLRDDVNWTTDLVLKLNQIL